MWYSIQFYYLQVTDINCPQGTQVPLSTSTIILAVFLPLLIIIVIPLVVMCILLSYNYRKETLRQNRNNIEGRNNQLTILSDGTQQESIALQYNDCYNQADSVHGSSRRSVNPTTNTITSISHRASNLGTSYVINSLGEQSVSTEEPYWDPACLECDLKQELKSLNVKEVSNEKIE